MVIIWKTKWLQAAYQWGELKISSFNKLFAPWTGTVYNRPLICLCHGVYCIHQRHKILFRIIKGRCNLFICPRRFGKTLNLSMLKYLFCKYREFGAKPEEFRIVFRGRKAVMTGETNTMCHWKMHTLPASMQGLFKQKNIQSYNTRAAIYVCLYQHIRGQGKQGML